MISQERSYHSLALVKEVFTMLFKKQKEESNIVEVPTENAGLLKRWGNAGYLMIHPEITKRALVLEFIRSLMCLGVFSVVGLWLFTELLTFIFMVMNYGILPH